MKTICIRTRDFGLSCDDRTRCWTVTQKLRQSYIAAPTMTTARFCFCWSLYLGWRTENSFRFLYILFLPQQFPSSFIYLLHIDSSLSRLFPVVVWLLQNVVPLFIYSFRRLIIQISYPIYYTSSICTGHRVHPTRGKDLPTNESDPQQWKNKNEKTSKWEGEFKRALCGVHVIRRRTSWLDSFVLHVTIITLEMKFYRIPTGKCRVCLYNYRTERYTRALYVA